MALKLSVKNLIEQALQQIETLSPLQVAQLIKRENVLLVDLRDIRELKKDGFIAGSKHIPRGMLEFWIDPESEYYQSYFDDAKQIIFYCNKGWRSALATKTVQDMGVMNVAHMQGGFSLWSDQNHPIKPLENKHD